MRDDQNKNKLVKWNHDEDEMVVEEMIAIPNKPCSSLFIIQSINIIFNLINLV